MELGKTAIWQPYTIYIPSACTSAYVMTRLKARGKPARILPQTISIAVSSLKKALELETQDPHAAHYNLGLAYDLTGQVTEAYYAFKKAEELRPDWDLPKKQLERYSVVSTG